ncbi:MAG: zf-HC2 domain-containing protein, partial [Bacillota bacterium]
MDCRRARELLPSLVDNELSPSGRASLLEHLNQCQSCQAEWQSLRSVIRMVRSLPEVTPPSDFRDQLYRRLHNEPVIVTATTKATSRG